jgi:Flp pilus assembly protein TadD
MKTNRKSSKALGPMALRFASGAVLGAALLAGTAYGDARAKDAQATQVKRSDEKAMHRAEQAVLKAPQDAALRAALGQVYLRAGRFGSATTAFQDAIALGDATARTALGLALSHTAQGNGRQAVSIIENARDGLPASDVGLGLALAGDTGRGVAVLSDALRGGDNSPKMRQNLAYAYALNGQWREARIMMSQDVPAEQIDARLTQWAMSNRPELFQQRVAALLGAPLRSDPGLPHNLALNAAPADVEVPVQAAAVVPSPAPAPAAELPPVEQAPAFATVAQAPAPAPALALAAEPAPFLSGSTQPLTPFAAPAPAPAPHANSLAAFDEFTRPVSSTLKAPQARPAAVRPARAPRAAVTAVSAQGSHVVQLGSFSSEQNARRAWTVFAARNPELANARMVITQAQVNGRTFWRVAAASFEGSTARGVCSSVKARGGACFAYAKSGPQANLLMARTEVRSSANVALARR